MPGARKRVRRALQKDWEYRSDVSAHANIDRTRRDPTRARARQQAADVDPKVSDTGAWYQGLGGGSEQRAAEVGRRSTTRRPQTRIVRKARGSPR